MKIKHSSFLVFLLTALFLTSLTGAMVVSIDIKEILNGRSSFFEFNDVPILEFRQDWENIGSLDCNAQMRLEIANESGIVARAWSKKAALAPGDNALLEAYCLPEASGDYEANMTLYYCNNIIPFRHLNFTYKRPEFALLNLSVSPSSDESTITFDIESGRNLTNLKIIPVDYPKTWIFEPINVGSMKAGEKKTVSLNYESAFWMPRNISFAFVSDEGYFEESVLLGAGKKMDYTVPVLITVLVLSILANIYAFFVLQKRKR